MILLLHYRSEDLWNYNDVVKVGGVKYGKRATERRVMVKGNWQKRVEIASARRQESKEKKNQINVHRQRKFSLQRFLKRLEHHYHPPNQNLEPSESQERNQYVPSKVHIWLDDEGRILDVSSTSDPPENISDDSIDAKTKKSHPRSSKRLVQSKSVHSSAKKTPNTFIQADEDATVDTGNVASSTKYMCRSYFFTGQCDQFHSPVTGGSHRRLRSACKHFHGCAFYSNEVATKSAIESKKTVWDVLYREQQRQKTNTGTASEQTLKDELQQSHQSEQMSNIEMPFNATKILSYFEINMESNDDCEKDENLMQTFQRHLRSNVLARHQLSLANIVYIAFDNVLVYDRYRQHENGILDLSDHNKGSIVEVLHVTAEHEPDVENEYQHLTATILNHILMFLPDTAVPTMELVCHSWYDQIRTTPVIWISMLERRGWSDSAQNNAQGNRPPSEQALSVSNVDETYSSTLRETFCQHYMIVQDMTALHTGFEEICRPESDQEAAVAIQNNCTIYRGSILGENIKVWSDNAVLVLSDGVLCDYKLLLFETNCEEYEFSEIISESVNWLIGEGYGLLSFGFELDDQYIYISSGEDCMIRNGRFQTAVVDRNDFTRKNSRSAWMTLNVRDAVINYIVVKCDDPSDPVLTFLSSDDGDEDELVLKHSSSSVLPCGHGQYLFDVVITTRESERGFGRGRESHISWKLCMFSMLVNEIVWSLELNQFSMDWSKENTIMSCVRRSSFDSDTQPTCDFTIWDRCSGKLLLGQVYIGGIVKWRYTSIQVPIVTTDNWSYSFFHFDLTYLEKPEWDDYRNAKYLIDTPTDIIMSYVKERHTVNCFYHKNADRSIDETCTELPMSRDLMVMNKPSRIRDCYVAFVCRSCDDGVLTTVVIHVPSRTEVYRIVMDQIPVWDKKMVYKHIPCIASDCYNSIGMCSSKLGVVMTGSNLRNRTKLSTEPSVPDAKKLARKKSSKRSTTETSSKCKKKDAFSRGSHRM